MRPPAPTALQQLGAAVRANLPAALVLWAGLAALLLAYALVPAVHDALARWGQVKAAWGLPFAFVSYVVFAVLVPETLGWLVRRSPGGWGQRKGELLYTALVFGCVGVSVDLLYRLQVHMFGEGGDARTVVSKMLFDQFVFSPVSNYLIVLVLAWREAGFATQALRPMATPAYFWQHGAPVIAAAWCVWIPGVSVVYWMPTALQFPVASLLLSFWILIFTFMRHGSAGTSKRSSIRS